MTVNGELSSLAADGFDAVYEDETLEDIAARDSLASDYGKRELNLTEGEQEFVDTKLVSKLWRMDNLYTIRTKDNVKEIMRLNYAQRKVLGKYKHVRKIILKSRQQGISTLFLAYYLDDCLFKPGYQAGIQSYGQDESDKLAKRALLMWDELDSDIKELFGLKLVSNNSKGMTFSNGSILKIGNFRGDTLQGLHVSELGKIAKRYPEKAKELRTGAFQAVGKNNKITLESTAEGKSGMFYYMWVAAKLKEASKEKLTVFDFEPIFLSWLEDLDCRLEIPYVPTEELDEYYSKLENELNIVIEDNQKAWYKAKEIELSTGGDAADMKQEYPSYPEEAFEQSVEGTIFRKEYDALVKENRYHDFEVDKSLPTYVSYDIGVNDETVLTFVQVIKGRPYVVNTYSNSREKLSYYVDIMKASGYNIVMVYLPHDANVQEFSSGRTRIEEFRLLRVPCRLLRKLSHKEYINTLRSFIAVLVIHSKNAIQTMSAIQQYRWKYDKSLGVYLQMPVHDESSNYIDSLKYMAMAIHYTKTLGIYVKEEIDEPIDMWELNDLLHSKGVASSSYAV